MITWACQKNTIGHHAGWGQLEIQPFCSRRITGDSGGGGGGYVNSKSVYGRI